MNCASWTWLCFNHWSTLYISYSIKKVNGYTSTSKPARWVTRRRSFTYTRPTLERRKTLCHIRYINPSIYHFASQSQTCQHLISLALKEIVKSDAVSGWTDEDRLLIWSFHSSSTYNHLLYLLVCNGNVASNTVNTLRPSDAYIRQ